MKTKYKKLVHNGQEWQWLSEFNNRKLLDIKPDFSHKIYENGESNAWTDKKIMMKKENTKNKQNLLSGTNYDGNGSHE